MNDGLAALIRKVETVFRLDGDQRIVGENDPDRSPGPRAFVAGCTTGQLIRLHADVAHTAAADAEQLVRSPAWSDAATPPPWLDALMVRTEATTAEASLIYALGQHALPEHPGLVRSDTADGAALISRLERGGLPEHLLQAGFITLGDFWAP